ncbi:hypothetical protein NDU88_000397, partial [Pleurodeles waltl]
RNSLLFSKLASRNFGHVDAQHCPEWLSNCVSHSTYVTILFPTQLPKINFRQIKQGSQTLLQMDTVISVSHQQHQQEFYSTLFLVLKPDRSF